MNKILNISVLLLLLAAANFALATETETAAEQLVAATVTLRISSDSASGDANATKPASEEVTVCSGVCLGEGRVVTFRRQTTPARFRITLPSGEQAAAEPRVIDAYSGLLLLEISDKQRSGLVPAATLPKVGATILTAAAAGIEQPAVSQGILGASDRTLSGADLPPLLQCDVRTSETGSGAGVIDASGQLIGIVVATPGVQGGWTYALPVDHLRRMLAAMQPGKLMQLHRRRPAVGLTIGPGAGEGVVLVQRVEPGGPAAKAGILPGDQVLAADGHQLRSAYQAVSSILKKQPGDKITLTVTSQGQTKSCEITLDGSAGADTVANAPLGAAATIANGNGVRIGPQLRARTGDGGQIEVRYGSDVQEVSADANPRVRRIPADEQEMLRIQVAAFAKVIQRLQDELAQRDQNQAELQKRIDSLKQEVERLEKQQTK